MVCNDQSPACCDTATVTVTVCETVANDIGRAAVCVDGTINIPINASTSCGNLLPPVPTQPSCGVVTVSGMNLVFNATGCAPGSYTFDYTVCNDVTPPCCDTATVTVTVCETVALDVGPVTVCVGESVSNLVNASTTCGNLQPPAVTSQPSCGTVTPVGLDFVFDATGCAPGTYTFDYQICNDLSPACCDTATVTVEVCATTAANDGRGRVCVGETLSLPVTNNDNTTCGALLPPVVTMQPSCGSVTVNGMNLDFNATGCVPGTYTFEYEICNDQSPACCDTAIVTVEVCDTTAVDDGPADVCVGDSVMVPVSDNDSTSCGDLLPPTVTMQPSCGNVTVSGANLIFDATGCAPGTYTFEYEICNDQTPTCCDRATVTVNVCSTVAADDEDETCPGETVSIPVSSNDNTTCDGGLDCGSISVISGPANGTAVRNGCNIDYTPNAGFVGNDSFQYEICSAGTVGCCAIATVDVTVNPAPDAIDDEASLPQVGEDPIVIDILANDLPGAPCTLVPSSVLIVQQPQRGMILSIDNATGEVEYKPNPDFLTGTDTFCYSVMNSCGCIDTACVTVRRPENDCPMRNRRQPGSLALFTEFDNRASNRTLITITNTNCDQATGSVFVHILYVDKTTCLKSDFTISLSPCDTWTAVTSAHNPNFSRGYIYAYARNAQGQAISFNHLIANQIVLSGTDAFDYGLNAVMFKAVPKVIGDLTDLDMDGIRDLDGVEYEEVPDRILVPRFLGQDQPQQGPHQSELILINLSGGSSFTATVDLMIYNDNEEGFSAQKSFFCWEKYKLSEVSGSFLQTFLKGTNHDPVEIIGAPGTEAGWFWVNGKVANSTAETIVDPAIYAVLIERDLPYTVADLPWEECVQDNGDLCPFGPLGDGPVPQVGDNQ
jgi:hypothetical protein